MVWVPSITYATDGGVYGPDFDPATVNHYEWGTGTFTFGGCYNGMVDLVPNQDYSDEFVDMTIYLTRLTIPEDRSSG